MKSLKIKLTTLAHSGQPVLSLVGSGPRTYIWVGELDAQQQVTKCYSFTEHDPKALRAFAQSLLKRLNAK